MENRPRPDAGKNPLSRVGANAPGDYGSTAPRHNLNVGEALVEARKQRGISIREAAEATKIRGDFLAAMENNSFEIDLPPIYIRGFLGNYARFLKLNPDKILADFDALQLGQKGVWRRESRDYLGRMEVPDRPPGAPAQLHGAESSERETAQEIDDSFKWKLAVAVLGLLVTAAALFYLIQVLRERGHPEINPELAATPPAQSAAPETAPVTGLPDEIVLVALDNVTVIVEQATDQKQLFSGTLNKGDRQLVRKTGAIVLRFTNGAALQVEKNGKTFKMGASGIGYSRME